MCCDTSWWHISLRTFAPSPLSFYTYGSHTDGVNSKSGRTRVVYAVVLSLGELNWRLWRMKFKVLLALLVMLFSCCPHVMSCLMWMLLPDIGLALRALGCGHAVCIHNGPDSSSLRLSGPGTWQDGTHCDISSPNLRACVSLSVGSWHRWLMLLSGRQSCHLRFHANRDVIDIVEEQARS